MSPLFLNIRIASLEDVRGITEVHCSDVDKWYKWKGGKRAEASYEELSIEERFLHGGPWMSIETCAIHLNYVLNSRQYPIVAEVNGKIVGELELYVGDEGGKLGKTAFIDVIAVHRDFRGRGIGKALIEKAREIAIKRGCDTLAVWPEREVVPFYEKCGLKEVAYNVVHLSVNLSECPINSHEYEIRQFPKEYSTLMDMVFISPRTTLSFVAWLKSRWDFAIKVAKTRSNEGYIPELGLVFVLEGVELMRSARSIFWVEDLKSLSDSASWLCRKAKREGWERLHMLIEESLYEKYLSKKFSKHVKGKELILVERLK